jgi:hypothetical protein
MEAAPWVSIETHGAACLVASHPVVSGQQEAVAVTACL